MADDITAADIPLIMRSIRTRIREEVLSEAPGMENAFNSPQALADAFANADELRTLRDLSTYPRTGLAPETISSHRPFLGRILVGAKRFVLKQLREKFLATYLNEELAYQRSLVSLLGKLSQLFQIRSWRLEDTYVTSLRELETTVNSRIAEVSAHEDVRYGQLAHHSALLEERLKTVEGVAKGLERVLAAHSSSAGGAPPPPAAPVPQSGMPDVWYLLLENRYRGSEEEIKERLRPYVSHFTGQSLPVLEIGAGRGELQLLFRDAGISSYAVDNNEAMVRRCRELGIDARYDDAIAHLEQVPPRSLGGVIAIQVVEHLPLPVLTRFLTLVSRALAPGAKAVFETINTASLVALGRNYFRDPTHAPPLHPESMASFLEYSGLSVLSLDYIHPFAEGFGPQPVPVEPYLPAKFRELLDQVNNNFERLNRVLYGFQDYSVVATPSLSQE